MEIKYRIIEEGESSRSPIFRTISMIQPVKVDKKIPVVYFNSDGRPVYTDKIDGHFISVCMMKDVLVKTMMITFLTFQSKESQENLLAGCNLVIRRMITVAHPLG